jgi:hypothetical protein
MTVVVGFLINKYPLLVGDILLSSEEIVGRAINLPLTGDVRNVFPEGAGFVPTGLRQKLVVIGDNLALGWSGTRIAAKTVIKEMIKLNDRTPFTKETLDAFIKNVDDIVIGQGVSFVGFLRDPETSGFHMFNSYTNEEPKKFTSENGSATIIGSAGDDLLNFIEPTGIKPHPVEEGVVQSTINTGLEYTGALLNFELTTQQTLLSYFGAGYELLTFANGKFQKVSDITYLFWAGEVSNKEVSISLSHIAKYDYVDDVLLIRSARVHHFEEENIKALEDNIFVIDPAYRESTANEIEKFVKPSYNSNFICSYFLNRKDGAGYLTIFTCIENVNSGKPSIEFAQNDNEIHIRIEKGWLDNFRAHILSRS